VNDVWGINSSSELFRFDPNNSQWNQIGFAVQVAAGGDGVWVIDESSNPWRFDSSAESFIEVTGDFKSIAVGSGAGIFGVSPSNQVSTWVRP